MRVKLLLYPKDDKRKVLTIALDFRHHFISLIKTLLQPSPALFSRFQKEKPGYSPYVFNVSFARILAAQKDMLDAVSPLTVTISTGDMMWFTSFCNGAIALKGQETILGLVVERIDLCQPVVIDKSAGVFSIRGHACLRKAASGNDAYVDPVNQNEVEESINCQAVVKARFLKKYWNIAVQYSPVVVLPESRLSKGVCSHYGGKLTTVRGSLVLAGEADSLQFLYDYGIGVRTGQGFGLVEVIKHYD